MGSFEPSLTRPGGLGMTLGVTGHRPQGIVGYRKSVLEAFALDAVRRARPSGVISGMALGWDQAVAVACVRLGVPFVAAVPFPGQERRWPAAAQQEYSRLLECASTIHFVTPEHREESFRLRNEWIVENSYSILALWGGKPSGTGHCVELARAGRRPVKNVWHV